MRKKSIFLCGAVALAMSACWSAYGFDDYDTPPVDAKRRMSIVDCRSFAGSFKSKSPLENQSEFQNNFGPPVEVNTSNYIDDATRTIYNYDDYSKVILSCSDDKCSVSCASKY